MLKNISDLGRTLNKNEQKSIQGGTRECQRRLFNLTAIQCTGLGGNYTTSGYCIVTIEGCQDPYLPVEL